MQKITPFLWFDKNAEEAMNYYVAVFDDAEIIDIARYPEDMQVGPEPGMGGKVLNGSFRLGNQQFMCLDGGPYFKFNEAISLMVICKDQAEIDYFWSKLSAVPESEQCGWCRDKFGLSWQIVPENIGELIAPPKAMQAMMQMKKLDIAELERAGQQ